MDRSMLQVFLGRIAQLKSCSVTWLRWCLAAMQRTKTLDNLHPLPPKLLPNLGFIWAQENWVGEIKLDLKSPMRKTDSCGKQANVAPTPKVQDSKNSCDSSFDTSVASPAYSRCPAAGVHVPTLEITPTVSNCLQAQHQLLQVYLRVKALIGKKINIMNKRRQGQHDRHRSQIQTCLILLISTNAMAFRAASYKGWLFLLWNASHNLSESMCCSG